MSWHATVAFVASEPFTEDAPWAVTEALAEHSAAASVAHDLASGEIALFVDGTDPIDAAQHAADLVQKHGAPLGSITLTGIAAQTEDAFETELARPVIPEVVGFAEIAEMGGVSRQRARQWAANPTFPEPVITTAQGPLMVKAAVQRWLETRNAKPGRPRASDLTAS